MRVVLLKSPDAANDNKRRTQFTEEDEQHLATWIAAKIPYKETEIGRAHV